MSKTYKTEGVIFRSLNYSETSLILDIYTQELGLGSYIVGGVRKTKSKKANVYHPMNIIDLVAYKGGEGLSRIKEANYAYTYERLDRDVVRSSIGTFIIDLLRTVIKERESDAGLYDFITRTLKTLDDGTLPLRNLPIRFAIELAMHLGFQFADNYSETLTYFDLRSGQFINDFRPDKEVLTDEVSEQLHLLMQNPSGHRLEKAYKNLLLDRILDYYKFHQEGFQDLRSLPVLRAILS